MGKATLDMREAIILGFFTKKMFSIVYFNVGSKRYETLTIGFHEKGKHT